MDFSHYTFRCSSLGALMTDPRGKSETLSETAKAKLIKCYVTAMFGREEEIVSKYITKGLMVEEDSITLYSLVKKKFFKKNEERIYNEYIEGQPDLFEGESLTQATLIPDIKSSWDIFTFFRTQAKPLNRDYYWQLQGYMDLSGARKAKLVYCLVNTPDILINDEKSKLRYKMGVIDPIANADYLEACEKLDKVMRYDDIPMSERVFEYEIERNDEDIERMHERVILCRKFLNAMGKTERVPQLQLN